MPAAPQLFSDDTDFVNVRGNRWHGRGEIEQDHARRHRLQLKDSVFAPLDVRVQGISDEIAPAHVKWKLEKRP